jgi:hypothetical protein
MLQHFLKLRIGVRKDATSNPRMPLSDVGQRSLLLVGSDAVIGCRESQIDIFYADNYFDF